MSGRRYIPRPHWSADQWAQIERGAAQARTFRNYADAGKRAGNLPQQHAMGDRAHFYEREVRRFATGAIRTPEVRQ